MIKTVKNIYIIHIYFLLSAYSYFHMKIYRNIIYLDLINPLEKICFILRYKIYISNKKMMIIFHFSKLIK